ncbi:hypothetical protein HOLleu_44445 [Holothuria leucospilota]|uniref:Uncharacterized protein n=1 Tax=Holothuria leucospilota TaxID=206669 RepID=A0A9Q1BAG6_HOLLE|nr:hypothetical protein HOLleu_44445 [Holothuria leucospilota]
MYTGARNLVLRAKPIIACMQMVLQWYCNFPGFSKLREETGAVPEWVEVVEFEGMELSSRSSHGSNPVEGEVSYHNPDLSVNEASAKVICWNVFRLHFSARAISKPLNHLQCDEKSTWLEADRPIITCREVGILLLSFRVLHACIVIIVLVVVLILVVVTLVLLVVLVPVLVVVLFLVLVVQVLVVVVLVLVVVVALMLVLVLVAVIVVVILVLVLLAVVVLVVVVLWVVVVHLVVVLVLVVVVVLMLVLALVAVIVVVILVLVLLAVVVLVVVVLWVVVLLLVVALVVVGILMEVVMVLVVVVVVVFKKDECGAILKCSTVINYSFCFPFLSGFLELAFVVTKKTKKGKKKTNYECGVTLKYSPRQYCCFLSCSCLSVFSYCCFSCTCCYCYKKRRKKKEKKPKQKL